MRRAGVEVLRRLLPRRLKRALKQLWDPNVELSRAERRVLTARRSIRPAFEEIDGTTPVVCLSIYDWEFRRQRPQHLMAGLAARGHRVLSVSRTTTALGKSARTKLLEPGIEEARLPVSRPLADAEREPLSENWIATAADAIAELAFERAMQRATIVVQIPSWGPLATEMRKRLGWKIVYDCMDDWSHFPNVSPALLQAERDLVATADRVIVSSEGLRERWSSANPVLIRNATDVSHFTRRDALELLPRRAPVIGYVGAVAEWFDSEAIIAAANAHPSWTFAIAGRVTVPFAPPDNVLLTGEKPYELVPAWMARFDVCLIPFRTGALTNNTDPVKLYEYFALGKPVVTAPIPEVLRYRNLVYVASSPAEWSDAIDRALRESDATLREARMRVARENDWSQRVDALERIIQ